MPKVYSQSEKDDIKGRLKEATRQSLSMNGIKKTTVDSLVKEVNIPKGTFYLFYKSKEILVFEVLLEFHEIFEKDMKRLGKVCLKSTAFLSVIALAFCRICI